jgi:hypothetical protein
MSPPSVRRASVSGREYRGDRYGAALLRFLDGWPRAELRLELSGGAGEIAVGSAAWNGRRVVACEVFRFRHDAAWTTDDALAPEPLPALLDLRAAWEAFCTTTRRRKLVLLLDDGSEVALFPFLRPGRVPAGLPAEPYRFWVAAHGNPWELAVES